MFIDVSRNNGKPYLRLVKSVRVKTRMAFPFQKKLSFTISALLKSLMMVSHITLKDFVNLLKMVIP